MDTPSPTNNICNYCGESRITVEQTNEHTKKYSCPDCDHSWSVSDVPVSVLDLEQYEAQLALTALSQLAQADPDCAILPWESLGEKALKECRDTDCNIESLKFLLNPYLYKTGFVLELVNAVKGIHQIELHCQFMDTYKVILRDSDFKEVAVYEDALCHSSYCMEGLPDALDLIVQKHLS